MFGGGGGVRTIETPAPEVVAAPEKKDKAVQDAAAEAIRRRKTTQGYRSTVLASAMLSQDQKNQLQTLGS